MRCVFRDAEPSSQLIWTAVMFEKIPLHQLLAQIPVGENDLTPDNQFFLFN
jgi:hypothetical protein